MKVKTQLHLLARL